MFAHPVGGAEEVAPQSRVPALADHDEIDVVRFRGCHDRVGGAPGPHLRSDLRPAPARVVLDLTEVDQRLGLLQEQLLLYLAHRCREAGQMCLDREDEELGVGRPREIDAHLEGALGPGEPSYGTMTRLKLTARLSPRRGACPTLGVASLSRPR